LEAALNTVVLHFSLPCPLSASYNTLILSSSRHPHSDHPHLITDPQ
jgi:hypothetical protein